MAQTMLLMPSSVSTNLKRDPSLQSQVQKLRPALLPKILFNPSLPTKPNSYKGLTTIALFKSKTKAPLKKAAPTPKPKTEDGIFGTSGGIGFTKQNELFVGRVAMIGFAASLLGEAVTGKGILSQLNLETGIPIYEAEPLLLFFILFTLLGAIGALGDRGRFVDDPPTGIDKAVIPPGKGVRGALGLKESGPLFGFTKANELFVGRLAQLGIAFSLIGEIITGKGALAQLNIETGIPINEIEPLVLFNVIFFFFAALNPGTGKFLTDEEEE
ncbi:Photosystem II 22 kDa family protein [Tripterygium wilfordii]|uniref:Photosystem II 22 kDa protein, chloroplastic n=1 Tax=Tripterygium wilfordii TaxID=458696 RepID=A0A7J7DRW9_TRIWF|nr:photosystem II 22 kDa protein, chloroplastic [Tripterygium wilfordii]KAF5749029.1 Photosystem II 22 kDa family protein [Tripterygium wilfordii]